MYASARASRKVRVAAQRLPRRSRPHSPTYVAMKVLVENWRWADVPFYVRTGKRLHERVTEIAIHFRRAPLALFGQQPAEYSRRNLLVISIQPHEAISIRFEARVPGPKTRLGSIHMDFSYADHFGQPSTTGYETLALRLHDRRRDAVSSRRHRRGELADHRSDSRGMEEVGARSPRPIPCRELGPAEADALLNRDGRAWHQPRV